MLLFKLLGILLTAMRAYMRVRSTARCAKSTMVAAKCVDVCNLTT